MVSPAESRPGLSEIIRVIGSEIMNTGLVSDQFNLFEMKKRLGEFRFEIIFR